ncbi:MAG: hypothetical protein HY791_30760 [Deltaproteobacteria bacterium]|nr:hypothetical protein [Deltaproteobacteria bacterium]
MSSPEEFDDTTEPSRWRKQLELDPEDLDSVSGGTSPEPPPTEPAQEPS